MLFSLLILSGSLSGAEDRRGEIYELGKVTGEPLYYQDIHLEELGNGQRRGSATVKNVKTGELLMTEKALLNGYAIISQEIEQFQVGEVYQLEVKDGKVFFRTFEVVDGERKLKDKETSEKVAENFITGPGVEVFLQKNFDALIDGKAVEALFGVFEVGRSIDFKFRKIASTDETITVKMRPSSFFISMMVDPIEIQLSTKTKSMVHYKGRTPVRYKDKSGKWKAMDGDIVYKPMPATVLPAKPAG